MSKNVIESSCWSQALDVNLKGVFISTSSIKKGVKKKTFSPRIFCLETNSIKKYKNFKLYFHISMHKENKILLYSEIKLSTVDP